MKSANAQHSALGLKPNWQFICNVYLIFLLIAMLCFFLLRDVGIIGELDDSLLPLVSMVNDQTLGVSEDDVAKASAWFPSWSSYLEQCLISPHYDLNGERMSYYFPTYPMAAVPVFLAMIALHMPKEHVFVITNILCLLGMLWLVNRHAKTSGFKKLLLLLALSLNPVLPYLEWGSMEVIVYCLLALSVFYWVNRQYHVSAILLSLAGTMNLTVMATGFFMIADYLINLANECSEKKLSRKMAYLFTKWARIIRYGCCYLIVFIPMIYNYINIGMVNIIIGGSMKGNPSLFTQWSGIASRAWAYLTDWNLGFLPFYPISLLVFIAVAVWGIIRRVRMPLLLMGAWILTILCYSVMFHINSGMDGIARYNAWSAAILLIAIFYYLPLMLSDDKQKVTCAVLVALCLCVATTCGATGIYALERTPYIWNTPIARFVLRHAPQLYSPLTSTFNSRTQHIDGGYYDIAAAGPVVYTNQWTNKILTEAGNVEEVLSHLSATDAQKDAIRMSVASKAPDELVYLSFADSERVLYIKAFYELGTPLNFAANAGELNGAAFVMDGISGAEAGYTWTNKREVDLLLPLQDYQGGTLHGIITYDSILGGAQQVSVFINDFQVYSAVNYADDHKISFDIPQDCIDAGILRVTILLPDAHKPGTSDDRVLGLALQEIVITD